MIRSKSSTALWLAALLCLSPCWAIAQSGAKALFYGTSAAMRQPGATGSGATVSGPSAAPAPRMATGAKAYPSGIGQGGSPTAQPSAVDFDKITNDLRAAAAAVPPMAPSAGLSAGTGGPRADGVVAPPVAAQPMAAPPMAAPPTMPPLGVRYWVELLDPRGARHQVTTEHVFRSGDRIKLHVSSNRDGHLTLTNLGTTGQARVLFPGAGADNRIRAGVDHAIPPDGYLRFDANRGQETLVLTFSPQARRTPAAAAATSLVTGAKDLLIEVDAFSSYPATYAVAPARAGSEGQSIAIQIKLIHL